jgi:NAD(P)-dependent dehydrogenase (short-subunit alcohol dehydrogenase family)
VFSYRSDSDAAARVRELVTESGGCCVSQQADVTSQDDVMRLFGEATQLGAVTGLVNNAGLTGHVGDYVHYAAAKAGVDALTVGLAKELADDGIRVNAVAPGVVNTEIHTRSR